jgi:hypothetical protein
MAEDDRPRPVQITGPGYVKDRTNHLRIQKDAAQRLIARYLREKMTPADANDMVNRICDGILSNMPAGGRSALRGFRMIPEYPRLRMYLRGSPQRSDRSVLSRQMTGTSRAKCGKSCTSIATHCRTISSRRCMTGQRHRVCHRSPEPSRLYLK